jgi:hypothetical protein
MEPKTVASAAIGVGLLTAAAAAGIWWLRRGRDQS